MFLYIRRGRIPKCGLSALGSIPMTRYRMEILIQFWTNQRLIFKCLVYLRLRNAAWKRFSKYKLSLRSWFINWIQALNAIIIAIIRLKENSWCEWSDEPLKGLCRNDVWSDLSPTNGKRLCSRQSRRCHVNVGLDLHPGTQQLLGPVHEVLRYGEQGLRWNYAISVSDLPINGVERLYLEMISKAVSSSSPTKVTVPPKIARLAEGEAVRRNNVTHYLQSR